MLEELVAKPHCIYVYGCNKICLNYLQISPYVTIQLIPVGVERSNGTLTGTSRLVLYNQC